jgi:hypothetical protein
MENQQEDPLEKLYGVVSSKKLYTKSFDEFKSKYSTDVEVNKIFEVVSREKLYTKDINSFKDKYFASLGKQKEGSSKGLQNTSQNGKLTSQISGLTDQALSEGLLPKLDTDFKPQLGRDSFKANQNKSKIIKEMPKAFLPFAPKEFSTAEFDANLQGIGAPIMPSNPNIEESQGIGGKEILDSKKEVSTKTNFEQQKDYYVDLYKGTNSSGYKNIPAQFLAATSEFLVKFTGGVLTGVRDIQNSITNAENLTDNAPTDLSNPNVKPQNLIEYAIRGLDNTAAQYEALGQSYQLPDDVAGQTTKGIIDAIPLIMSLAGGAGEAKLLSNANVAIGKLISENAFNPLTKTLTTQGFVSTYGNERAQGKTTTQSLTTASEAGAQGFKSGLELTAMGGLANRATPAILEGLMLKGFTAPQTVEKVTHALVMGISGGGVSVAEDLSQGNEIDTDKAIQQFALFTAFGLGAIGKSIANDVTKGISQGINKIGDYKLDKAVYEKAQQSIRDNDVLAVSATRSFLGTDINTINIINKSEGTHQELQGQSLEFGMKALEVKERDGKVENFINQDRLQKMSDIKFVTENIVNNKEAILKSIDEMEIADEAKQAYKEKIEAVYENNAPKEIAKQAIAGEILEKTGQSKKLDTTIKNSKDPIEVSKARIEKEKIDKSLEELNTNLDNLNKDTATPQQSVSTDVVQDTPIVDVPIPVSEVAIPALKDVESAPQVEIPKNIIEAFKGGEKGITAGKQKALENFRKAGGKATSGLNVEQAAYALEYAILSIADGTIKTAKSLAKALGVKQEEVESIYNDATTKLTAYRKAEVNKSGDTIKQTIKKNTSGGTVGKTTKTVRQAIKDFYTTYNKGIREGVKQGRGEGGAKLKDFKENITNRKALSRGLRNDIRQLLINAKKSGKIGGTVSGFRSTNLAKVIANAETPQQLVRALDYTEKYINDAEYDTKVKQGKSLQTKIKGLASRKGVPVNLKETLKQISKIDLVKLEDIDKTNSILDKVSKILVNPLLTEDLYTEVDFVKQAIQIVEDYNKKKSEEITNELQLGGVDAQTLETLSIKDKQQMLLEMYSETSLNEDGLETENPPKEKATEQYRRVAKTLQNLIEDYVDTEGLTDIQKRDIEDIKNIDIDGVADKDLARLVFGLTNLVNTNSTVGIGDIVVTGKVATQAANTTLVNSVKDNIRKVVENVYAKYFRTGSNRLAFFVKNEKFIGRVNNLMGLTAFKLGSIDYNNAKAEIIKKMTELRKKHKEAFRNPVKSMLLSIYSDASQFKDSMSVEEKLTEYENRLVSWGKSLDKMKKEAVLSLSYNKENKNFIATAEESFNQVATLQFDEDGKISGVELKLTQEQLFKELGEAHQEFYKIMRDSYDQHKEDYFRVSEYYGNKELDKDIQNYIFRGYKTIDSPQADLVNSTKNNLDVVKKLASGSSEGRTNWGANLPSNRVLDFDIMGRFESDISAMLYDINTLEHRLYISKATNLKSSPIVEALGEGNKDVAKTYHEIVEMAVEQDRLQFGGNSLNKSAFLRLIGAVNKTGVAIALGGVGQYIKQTTPLIDTSVRLRNPINVLKAITIMFDKPEGFDAVFKYANVSTRDIVKDNTPINVNTKGYKSTNSAIINALRNLGVRAEDITEFTTNISLLPLQQTDKGIAGTSWVAFYIDYLQDAGKEVSFEKLDTEALDYADLMSSNVNNESDPRFKSKVSKNKYFQTFLPFMNFAINSKMDLINNLSKLNTAGAEKGRIIQNISGNISGILAYNTVALGFRSAVIGSTYGLAKAAIQAYTDDDDEREKLAEVLETYQEEKSDTNFVNYTKYVVKDLLFANIGAQSLDLMVDPLTDAIVDVPIRLYDKVTGDNVYGRNEAKTTFKYQPNDYEKLVANFGVAAPFFTRLADAYKYIKENNETDDSFIEQRKGKINAEGTDLIVDDYYKTEKGKQEFGKSILSERIDLFSMLASITSLSGGSLQEISAFKRGLNSIDRLFVEELRGKVKIKDKEKALKDYLDFSAIEVNGKEVLLSKEAQDEIATNFTKNVKQQKLEKPFGSYKNSMVKSDYETFIGNVSKGLAKQKYIQDNITNFTEPVKPKNVNKKITERNNLIKYQK